MGNVPKRPFIVAVRGVEAEAIDLTGIDVGLYVRIENEPDNPVDENAVVVYDGNHKIGYFPKDVAARVDPAEWQAVVAEVYRKDGRTVGYRLECRPREVDLEF